MDQESEQYIQECQEWIASRKAWLDQRAKQFNDQYPNCHPKLNHKRMIDLEAWKFEIEIEETELQEYIQMLEDEDEAQDS